MSFGGYSFQLPGDLLYPYNLGDHALTSHYPLYSVDWSEYWAANYREIGAIPRRVATRVAHVGTRVWKALFDAVVSFTATSTPIT